jgi:hypothetical protein
MPRKKYAGPRCWRCDCELPEPPIVKIGRNRDSSRVRLTFCTPECFDAFMRGWRALHAQAA